MASDSTETLPAGTSGRRPSLAPGVVLYVPASRAREGIGQRLAAGQRPVVVARDMASALERLAAGSVDACIIDLSDDRGAIPLIRLIRAQHPGTPIVAVADAARPLRTAEAIDSGVWELLAWPFEEREIEAVLANAGDRIGINGDAGGTGPRIFAHSAAMRQVVEQLQAAAAAPRAAVGFSGDAGTGRGLLARALHEASGGARGGARPFVVVNCAGPGRQEIECALFGAAPSGRVPEPDGVALERLGPAGAVVSALGGTVVLRNLSEAPARVQARLARLLRDGEGVLGSGQDAVTSLDLRPVAIFGPDVDAEVADGRLRRDLVDRFSSFRIEVPPLRRRREDIPALAVQLLGELTRNQGLPARGLSRSVLALFGALPWRGNVPELRSLLETLVRATRRPVIQLDQVLEYAPLDGFSGTIDPGVTLRDAKVRFERDCISAVLMRHHGRVGEAAKALGIQRTNLYRKVRQLNVARSLLSARK